MVSSPTGILQDVARLKQASDAVITAHMQARKRVDELEACVKALEALEAKRMDELEALSRSQAHGRAEAHGRHNEEGAAPS